MSTLASRLTAFRKKWNIPQAEMARALSVPRSTLWRWETGKARPSYDKLEQLNAYMNAKELEG